MSDDRPPEILGSLPNTRPHRRSAKRGVRRAPTMPTEQRPDAPSRAAARKTTGAAKRPAATRKRRAESLRQPEQPAGNPPAPRARRPAPVSGTELAGTIVKATAELAEIGLSVTARTLRGALARLPRP